MKLKNYLANLATMLNLISGLAAIFLSINKEFFLSAILILVAVIFDFLDGQLARRLNIQTHIGAELDSLSDLVSFGVAPAVLMHSVFQTFWLDVILVLFVLTGAYRLARFNVLRTQMKGFLGMPITINGVLFPLALFLNTTIEIVAFLFVLSAILMVSTLKFNKVM